MGTSENLFSIFGNFYGFQQLLLTLFLYVIYAVIIKPQLKAKFKLIYQGTQQNQTLVSLCKSIKNGFYHPTLYLGIGTLQALYATSEKKKNSCVKFIRKKYDLGDYGKFTTDWAYFVSSETMDQKKTQSNKKEPLIILIPGLVASINEPYVIDIVEECMKMGFKVVIVNDRIYHDRQEIDYQLLPKQGYFSFVKDFKLVLQQIVTECQDQYTFYGIGLSFGANTLIKFLGMFPNENPFKAAVSISNPWNMKKTMALLPKYMDKYMLTQRQTVIRRRQNYLSRIPEGIQPYNLKLALEAKNNYQFDDALNTKIFGFPDYNSYHDDISCVQQIASVQIPTLCISALDDPVIDSSVIPVKELKNNPNIITILTNSGGHVGWFEGFSQPKRWYTKPTIEYLYQIAIQHQILKN